MNNPTTDTTAIEQRAREVLSQHTDAWEGVVRVQEALNAMIAFRTEALEEASQWQDIATAPKVHGAMILGPNRYGVVDIFCWNDSLQGWDDGNGYDEHDVGPFAATYWMPVPALSTSDEGIKP